MKKQNISKFILVLISLNAAMLFTYFSLSDTMIDSSRAYPLNENIYNTNGMSPVSYNISASVDDLVIDENTTEEDSSKSISLIEATNFTGETVMVEETRFVELPKIDQFMIYPTDDKIDQGTYYYHKNLDQIELDDGKNAELVAGIKSTSSDILVRRAVFVLTFDLSKYHSGTIYIDDVCGSGENSISQVWAWLNYTTTSGSVTEEGIISCENGDESLTIDIQNEQLYSLTFFIDLYTDFSVTTKNHEGGFRFDRIVFISDDIIIRD